MRIAVTGRHGQIATALRELGEACGHQILALGRPELDLARPDSILPALASARPQLVISAAAYTAVDQAESDPAGADLINHRGAAKIAEAAAALSIPLIHLSTDYVFDGAGQAPFVETDPPAPLNVYGASKLAGEKAVAAIHADHVIVRTSWVYSPFGGNFVKTMLRLAESRDRVRVVDDQIGQPSAAHDLAAALLAMAQRLIEDADTELRGVYHCAGTGETSWAGFATAIFTGLRARGGREVTVEPIASADYPTPARRPANSRLDTTKLTRNFGIVMPEWRRSLSLCLDRLIGPGVAPDRSGEA